MEFSEYILIMDLLERAGAIAVPFGWAKNIASQLPKLDLGLPETEKTSKIAMIIDKKNPIYIQLVDGTKLYFTYDEFNRIEGKPAVGKDMVVTFQRLPSDKSLEPSQISKCKII